MYPPPCIHSPDGRTLCPDCQAEYDYEPMAYVEYGEHPAGRENYRLLMEEIARDAQTTTPAEADPNIPF